MDKILWSLVLIFALSVPALAVDHGRLAQINTALHKRGYKTMKDAQKANGWQTRYCPDSRLLIWLGFAPEHNNLGSVVHYKGDTYARVR